MNQDEAYRRAVATLPCANCGIEGYSQAAHSNLPEHGKGRGMKALDVYTFPLCATRPGINGCHVEHDQLIGVRADEAKENTYRWLMQTWSALWERKMIAVDLRKIPKP